MKAQHTVAGLERGLAPEALLIIRKLYVIEKLARDAGMTPDERHRLRNEKARPIWDELAHMARQEPQRDAHRCR